ncbi:unnamed protein product [marine sediment metagenome]|uniref:Tetrapyrrole methylase domain-containing protein n=1 Tax=marine sediment metagenome TaxID=412755 RepID=X1E7T3_9ZZZZ
MFRNKVYIVGVGPGSPKYLTREAEEAIREASVIVGWELDLLPARHLIDGKKIYLQNVKNYVQVAETAAKEARKSNETVAVLRIGDPCISSGLDGLLKVFPDFEVRIVSGISSIQLAAAAAQINIDESVLISFHDGGDDFEKKRRFMLDGLNQNRHLIILTGPDLGPKEAAIYLTNNGISEITPAIVCENLALSDEKISRGTLQDMAAKQFSWRSVMVVI